MSLATHTPMRTLFDLVVDLPDAVRAEYLARECSGQPGLLAELEELLVADRCLQGTTIRPLVRFDSIAAAMAPEPLPRGQRAGRYVLREVLGRGGMGLVHRAECVDGAVGEVAIKFVRRELLDEHTRRRFMLERQWPRWIIPISRAGSMPPSSRTAHRTWSWSTSPGLR